ncbi:hypothetical protein NDU88_003321 [Pleurodeles waltl]|uniref:Uncharacterized protein n=1 Tax=Pleurodeles waltl TaxID=8319 RepID=A0AAV7NPD3_PLEWA|nr:hypothetical protein NDU88_003321 [Pleurodeles waltl]
MWLGCACHSMQLSELREETEARGSLILQGQVIRPQGAQIWSPEDKLPKQRCSGAGKESGERGKMRRETPI